MGLLALMGEAAGALMLIEKLTENPKARAFETENEYPSNARGGFFPENTDVRKRANTALSELGYKTGHARIREKRNSSVPAWEILWRAPGKMKGKKVAEIQISQAEARHASANPLQKSANFGKRFFIHSHPGEGGFEYGWDGRTPIQMKITFAVKAPRGAAVDFLLPERIVNTPGFQDWYKLTNKTIYGTKTQIIRQLEEIAKQAAGTRVASNPRGRSKDSVKRASQATGRKPTKRLVKRRTKTKAAPKGFFANPVKHGYDVEANGARVATFKTRTHAREYGQAFANKYRVQVKLREV
jgi:hypothetical protein